MITVGVRELKQQTSALIRLVRETGSEIQITYHGQIVALLVPINKTKSKNASHTWTQLDILAAEIGASWKEGMSAAKATSHGRR
jgi:prevent-host-death family protein